MILGAAVLSENCVSSGKALDLLFLHTGLT